MTVGVLDSGLHSQLLVPGRVNLKAFSTWSWDVGSEGWHAKARETEPEEIARWWLEEHQPDPCWDTCGHGTQVCRILVDGKRAVSLVAAQVLDNRGQASEGLFLAAWDWIISFKPDVINFSVGCHAQHPDEWMKRAEICHMAGIKIFAAAGKVKGFPACLSEVAAVGDFFLRADPEVDPHWKALISHWVSDGDLPDWVVKSSSSLACAVAVRDYFTTA